MYKILPDLYDMPTQVYMGATCKSRVARTVPGFCWSFVVVAGAFVVGSGTFVVVAGTFVVASGTFVVVAGTFVVASGTFVVVSGAFVVIAAIGGLRPGPAAMSAQLYPC